MTAALEESYKFNVAVSELMKLSNTLKVSLASIRMWLDMKMFVLFILQSLSQPLMGSIEYHNTLLVLCKLMFPFVPHFSAQIWEGMLCNIIQSTVKPVYSARTPWDPKNCPDYRGVLISQVH